MSTVTSKKPNFGAEDYVPQYRGGFGLPHDAPAAPKKPAPWMSYDEKLDQVTIDGVVFAADFFRTFSLAPRGTLIRLTDRQPDGSVGVRVYQKGQAVVA